jgi:hypothetical protein
MKKRISFSSIPLLKSSTRKAFQGFKRKKSTTSCSKKIIASMALCLSTISVFAQQEIQSDTSKSEEICKQLTKTRSKNLIIFKDFAEYNIVFIGDKTVSHDIKVSNIKTNAIQYFSFVGNQVTLTLPLHQKFVVSDVKCDKESIAAITTEYINPNEPLEVSTELMNALSLDEDFKNKRINLFDLINRESNINYYEKLKFLQVHLLQNKPISYQFNIHPSNFIDSTCNGGIKFSADPFDNEPPIDGPIFDADPEIVACKATLTLRNSSDFKNDLIKVKIPYDHYISSGTYSYTNPYQSNNYHTEFHENTKGIGFTKRISNEDWYQNAFVGSLGPKSIEITNMSGNNSNNSSDNMSFIDLNLVVTNGGWFQSECGCEKKIMSRLRYDFYHEIYSSDKGTNGSFAKAQTEEIASAQIIDINSGIITPIKTNYLQVSNSCATSLNPAFITQLNQVATSLVSVGLSVVAAAISGGSTAVINAIAANNSTSSLATGLIGIFNTNSHLYQDTCGAKIHNPVAFDAFYNFALQPNSRKIISLTSMQKLYVAGQKKWKSQAIISGGGYISLFIKPNGTKTGIWKDEVDCCSPQAGIWMQASMNPTKEAQYLSAISGEMYMNDIVGWLPQYTSGTYVNTYGNYSLILGNTPSDCKKPILFERHTKASEQQQASCNWSDNILYITSKNKIGAAYEVYDIGGELLKTGIIESDQQFALETATKTMYIIKIISNSTLLTLKTNNL